ncbi:MAG: VTT domain-containing protein [Caldilineaceae bacterium]
MTSEQSHVEESLTTTMPQSSSLTLSQTQQRWLGGAIVVLICLVSFWLAINPAWVQRFGHWGYLGAFLISLVASATIILPAPGIVVVIAMGAALNPIVLGIVAGLGSAFGELTGYAAGRGGRTLIPAQQQKQFEQIQSLTRKHGPLLLAVLAAIPFPLFDFAGIVAGMLRIRVFNFFLAVAIGKSIKYVIMIILGTTSFYWLQQML